MGDLVRAAEPITLESVCTDLFDIFEKENVLDRDRRVDQYFTERARETELLNEHVDVKKNQSLAKVVKQEILPAYHVYSRERSMLIEKRDNRKIWKYAVGSVALFEVAGAIITRGGSFHPRIMFPTIFVEAFVGATLYKVAKWTDDLRIGKLKKKFFRTVGAINEKLSTEHAYQAHFDMLGDDLMDAESIAILQQYETSDRFWQDYRKARIADPTNEVALEMLKLPAFDGFLGSHIYNDFTTERRRMRWDKLYMLAHEYFISKDKSYVLRQLEKSIV